MTHEPSSPKVVVGRHWKFQSDFHRRLRNRRNVSVGRVREHSMHRPPHEHACAGVIATREASHDRSG